LRYVFEACVLDTDRRELRRDDAMVAVEPQVFDLIAYLIRNRDRVVDRDDLRAAIWSGRIVSESTLNTRINAARSAIGDSGGEQRLIRTLPRKGFRFVGDVHGDDAAPPQPDAAAGLAPASGADRQVAVWQADGDVAPAPHPAPAELLVPSDAVRRASRARRIALAAAAVTAAVVLALVLINARPRIDAMLHPPQRFDADVMPPVTEEGRRELADSTLYETSGRMPRLLGRETLTTSWEDVLWAAITVGRPNRQFVFQYGAASIFEAIFRLSGRPHHRGIVAAQSASRVRRDLRPSADRRLGARAARRPPRTAANRSRPDH